MLRLALKLFALNPRIKSGCPSMVKLLLTLVMVPRLEGTRRIPASIRSTSFPVEPVGDQAATASWKIIRLVKFANLPKFVFSTWMKNQKYLVMSPLKTRRVRRMKMSVDQAVPSGVPFSLKSAWVWTLMPKFTFTPSTGIGILTAWAANGATEKEIRRQAFQEALIAHPFSLCCGAAAKR